MDKLLELLKEAGVEITDDLKTKIKPIWPKEVDTDGLFDQDAVNDIVQKRLAREQKLHEQEVTALKESLSKLVDPEKLEEYKTKIGELEGQAKTREAELKKEYELRLAAVNAGVTDPDYIDFLAEKKGYKDRLTLDDKGRVVVTDAEGRVISKEDGNPFGAEKLIEEFREIKPEIFAAKVPEKKKSTGPTNPGGGGPVDEDKLKRSRELAAELGYAQK